MSYFDWTLAHLALAAFFAIDRRFAGLSLSALAFPPFCPPRRPSATAAGFLVAVVVDSATMTAARRLGSEGFLERVGMR
jgi:hypothetical protein